MVSEWFQMRLPLADSYKPAIGPWGRGPYLRLQDGELLAVVGQWALIGDRDRKAQTIRPRMTNNAERRRCRPVLPAAAARGWLRQHNPSTSSSTQLV